MNSTDISTVKRDDERLRRWYFPSPGNIHVRFCVEENEKVMLDLDMTPDAQIVSNRHQKHNVTSWAYFIRVRGRVATCYVIYRQTWPDQEGSDA